MYKTGILLLAIFYATLAAEIPTPNMLEQLSTFKPADIPIERQHFNKDIQYEKEHHPVYRGEEFKNEGRARIEPVRSQGPVVKHDMQADDSAVGSTDVNRVDNLPLPEYGYGHPPSEVAYPDIPYAPGYGYGNGYDVYGNSLSDYLLEPDTSTFGLLWSQVPDSRTIVHLMGRTIGWILNSVFVLLIGSLITVGVCSYTNLCTISFQGVGPIHEEMRSFITPERLEKISTAANFVKTAIDKYQKIQKVTDQARALNCVPVLYGIVVIHNAKMGNTKSKKVKITQAGPVGAENESRERINTIKTDVFDVNAKKNDVDKDMDQMEEKQHDNASSASTVEVLDDK